MEISWNFVSPEMWEPWCLLEVINVLMEKKLLQIDLFHTLVLIYC